MFLATLASEIKLKSKKVRSRFLRQLMKNIKAKIHLESIRVYGGYLILDSKDKKALYFLTRTFGLHYVIKTRPEMFIDKEHLIYLIEKKAEKVLENGKTFALRVKRRGIHDFSSIEVANLAGEKIRKKISSRVDLKNPEQEFFVLILGDRVFLYENKDIFEALKGLPLGVSGEAVVLSQNKKEDVVAAFLMMKRGLRIDFLGNNNYVYKLDVFSPFKINTKKKVPKECPALVSPATNLNEFQKQTKKKTFMTKYFILKPLLYLPKKIYNSYEKKIFGVGK